MVTRPRTRLLRRAVITAALGALVVPATAGAAVKNPVITKVTPKTADVGAKLTIQGRNFNRGKGKNRVLFRRNGGKALFVKADVSTAKRLTVVLPKSLEKYMVTANGKPAPTRFRLRVLTKKLGKKYTSVSASPVIGPERANGGDNSGGAGVPTAPDGDCDADGVKNALDADDDNDLLDDATELALKLDPCVGDTDGDGVEDGYEYQSALDLNNDDYQEQNLVTPYPGKTAYPNPLFKDADVDYDGDGLDLIVEQALWKYTYQVSGSGARTLSPLSYSDGAQYSLSELQGGHGRRVPTMRATNYEPPQRFRSWADNSNYGHPMLFALAAPPSHTASQFDLFDMNRSGGAPSTIERDYWNEDGDDWVSDDERDEDSDGLTNFHETIGPMSAEWWKACYSGEGAFPITYAGTKPFDADSDGDGVLDGADDQDFDDVPNIMELTRHLAGNVGIQQGCGTTPASEAIGPATTWVNPFNPCLPDRYSRTCERHPQMGAGYPPFQQQWKRYVLY